MDNNIQTYLRELQDAMASAGADPALVQDALYDAEEHLQAEMAAGGQFADVAQVYGSPEEVAAAYLGVAPAHEMAAALGAPYPRTTPETPPMYVATPESAAPVSAEDVPVQEAPAAERPPAETAVAPGATEAAGAEGETGLATDQPAETTAGARVIPTPGTEAPRQPSRVFCRQCGMEAEPGQGYCRRCGTRISPPQPSQPPHGGQRPSGGQPPYGQPQYGGQSPYGAPQYGAPPQAPYPVGVQAGMAAAAGGATTAPNAWRQIFGVFADGSVWLSLVYMILSLGLGIVYFTVVVTGLSTAGGMVVLIVGIPLLVLVLGLVRALSLFEGRVVEVFLGTRMPRRLRPVPPNLGFFERIWFWLKDSRTWLSMLYMVLMLPLGIVYFTIAVTGLAVSLSMIASPFWVWFGDWTDHTFIINGEVHNWWFPAWSVPLAFILGCILLVAFMHLVKWVGRGHAAFAKAMLVRLK